MTNYSVSNTFEVLYPKKIPNIPIDKKIQTIGLCGKNSKMRLKVWNKINKSFDTMRTYYQNSILDYMYDEFVEIENDFYDIEHSKKFQEIKDKFFLKIFSEDL